MLRATIRGMYHSTAAPPSGGGTIRDIGPSALALTNHTGTTHTGISGAISDYVIKVNNFNADGSIRTNATVARNTTHTLEFRFMITSWDSRTEHIIPIWYESGANTFIRLNSTGSIYLTPDGNTAIVSSTGLVSLNTWYHVAWVYTATGAVSKLYLNGTNVAQISGITPGAAKMFGLGGTFSSALQFKDYVEEVILYNTDAIYTGNFTPPATVHDKTDPNITFYITARNA